MARKWGSSVRGGAAVSAFVLCACGASQQNTKSPAGEDSSEGVGQDGEPAAPRILKPAAAPSGIVARFRVKNVAGMADSLLEAASTPVDWRRMLEEDTEEFPWAVAVDWGGAIEGVLAMNVKNPQEPHGAFSVGVQGTGPVLSLLEKQDIAALEGPGEVFYFEVSGDDCAVGPALGKSPARVVCSQRRTSLDLLVPYMLRGLPTLHLSDADVHMEFEMEPLRAAYGKELKTLLRWAPAAARSQHQGNRTFDSALSDGAAELAREGTALIDELTRVTLQVEQEAGDFTGTVNLELKGAESDVAKILTDFEARQNTLPDIFDELPSTASAAGYSREISKKYSQKWMSIVADLLRGSAEMEGASQAFSKRLGAVVKQLGPEGTTGVYARGPLVAGKVGKKEGLRSAWVLSGTTRSKDDVVRLLDDVAWLMASSDLKKLAPRTPDLPEVRRKNIQISGAAGATVFEWKLPPELIAVAKLAGAQISSEAEMGDVLDSVQSLETGLIAVHQIGENTWISWGQSKDEIAESFGALTAKDAQKLGSLGDLGGVRSEPAVSAGFSRLDGLVGMASFLFPGEVLDDWPGFKLAMPNRGNVPVLYSFSVTKGSLTTATWKVHVPTEFTRDLVAFGMKAQDKHRAGQKPQTP